MSEETISDISGMPLVVGVDLGGTQIRVAVLSGTKLLSRIGLLTGRDSVPESIIPRIYNAIQQAVEEANTSLDQIAGIGIGVPGPVHSPTGVVFEMPNLQKWKNVQLRNILENDFHIKTPIFIDNDANVAALGEYMFGAGQGSDFMVYLTLSTGIGGSVIIDGQIMRGTSGAAMEIGHMTIHGFGERCNCGNIGCLESIASGTAIARSANRVINLDQGTALLDFARALWASNATDLAGSATLISDSIEHKQEEDDAAQKLQLVDARIVALAAEAGVPVARAIIKRAADALGIGLVNIIHVFNPERIILGGGLMQMGHLLMNPALKIVHERAMTVPRNDASIVEAQLDANVGLIGAGALVFHELGLGNAVPIKVQEN